jgi:hypothetical protein
LRSKIIHPKSVILFDFANKEPSKQPDLPPKNPTSNPSPKPLEIPPKLPPKPQIISPSAPPLPPKKVKLDEWDLEVDFEMVNPNPKQKNPSLSNQKLHVSQSMDVPPTYELPSKVEIQPPSEDLYTGPMLTLEQVLAKFGVSNEIKEHVENVCSNSEVFIKFPVDNGMNHFVMNSRQRKIHKSNNS